MKLNLFKPIVILSSLLLIHCTNNQTSVDNNVSIIDGFPKQTHIKFANYIFFNYGSPRRFYVTDSALIICNNTESLPDFHFYQYSLRNQTLVHKYIRSGRGKKTALNAFSSGLYNDKILWLHDITLMKILTVPLNDQKSNSDSLLINEFNLAHFYYSVQLLDTLNLVVTGEYVTHNKIQELFLPTSITTNQYGTYHDSSKINMPFFSFKRAYESFLYLKPSGNKIVTACRYADQIEIFDRNSKKSKIIKGPENYLPEVTPFKSKYGDMVERNNQSRFGFVNGMVTDRFIYLLYSGNNHNSQYRILGKTIYVYDWDGNPIREIFLDRYITGFTITKDDSLIYAYDPETKYIMNSKIVIK